MAFAMKILGHKRPGHRGEDRVAKARARAAERGSASPTPLRALATRLSKTKPTKTHKILRKRLGAARESLSPQAKLAKGTHWTPDATAGMGLPIAGVPLSGARFPAIRNGVQESVTGSPATPVLQLDERKPGYSKRVAAARARALHPEAAGENVGRQLALHGGALASNFPSEQVQDVRGQDPRPGAYVHPFTLAPSGTPAMDSRAYISSPPRPGESVRFF